MAGIEYSKTDVLRKIYELAQSNLNEHGSIGFTMPDGKHHIYIYVDDSIGHVKDDVTVEDYYYVIEPNRVIDGAHEPMGDTTAADYGNFAELLTGCMWCMEQFDADKYFDRGPSTITVKTIEPGSIKALEAFRRLESHLEKVGLLPDEYFIPSMGINEHVELPRYNNAICYTDWGGSEGIYIDINLSYRDEVTNKAKYFNFATGKTLGETGDDFLRMSRIAAECSMMLNGRGIELEVPRSNYDNLRSAPEKESLVEKIHAAETKSAECSGNKKQAGLDAPGR